MPLEEAGDWITAAFSIAEGRQGYAALLHGRWDGVGHNESTATEDSSRNMNKCSITLAIHCGCISARKLFRTGLCEK